MNIKTTIVCPGCGWIGTKRELYNKTCKNCGYENGESPFRLLTVEELLKDNKGNYCDVNMGKFLTSLLKVINESTN